METLNKLKEYIIDNIIQILTIILLLLSIVLLAYLVFFKDFKTQISNVQSPNYETVKTKDKEEALLVNKVKVDIKGFIKKPGVYELDSNSIVNDVIKLAGGIKKGGTTSNINLSKKISDEMVIIIYSPKQLKQKELAETSNCPVYDLKECNDGKTSSIIENKPSTNNNTDINKTVSINNATIEELMTLPGIGESKAKSIIEYRNTNGNFEKIEDIMNVSGIGESVFAKIKENITL